MIIDDKTIISSLYIGTSAVWLFLTMTLRMPPKKPS